MSQRHVCSYLFLRVFARVGNLHVICNDKDQLVFLCSVFVFLCPQLNPAFRCGCL